MGEMLICRQYMSLFALITSIDIPIVVFRWDKSANRTPVSAATKGNLKLLTVGISIYQAVGQSTSLDLDLLAT